jgi:hypothetical protein
MDSKKIQDTMKALGEAEKNKKTLTEEQEKLAAEEQKKRDELAGRIYDLDVKTYKAVGSSLGRVFPDDRDASVIKISHYLKYTDLEHIVHSEMALISNMARTIRDKEVRAQILAEYDQILGEVKQVNRTFTGLGIDCDTQLSLDRLKKVNRQKDGNHLIICVRRSYGSAASPICLALADALGLNYYNTEIFKTVMARLEAEQDGIQDEQCYMPLDRGKEHAGPAVPFEREKHGFRDKIKRIFRYHGLPARDAIFFNQSDVILQKAKTEDFIIVGRCANVILENSHIPHLSIYITAALEQRVHRIASINHLSEKDALKQIREVDKGHADYYKYFTSKRWGNAGDYDLCLNTSIYGVDGAINFILKLLKSEGIIEESDINPKNKPAEA